MHPPAARSRPAGLSPPPGVAYSLLRAAGSALGLKIRGNLLCLPGCCWRGRVWLAVLVVWQPRPKQSTPSGLLRHTTPGPACLPAPPRQVARPFAVGFANAMATAAYLARQRQLPKPRMVAQMMGIVPGLDKR